MYLLMWQCPRYVINLYVLQLFQLNKAPKLRSSKISCRPFSKLFLFLMRVYLNPWNWQFLEFYSINSFPKEHFKILYSKKLNFKVKNKRFMWLLMWKAQPKNLLINSKEMKFSKQRILKFVTIYISYSRLILKNYSPYLFPKDRVGSNWFYSILVYSFSTGIELWYVHTSKSKVNLTISLLKSTYTL